MTVKARELIGAADYVLHDALIAPETLALCGPDTRLENSASVAATPARGRRTSTHG